MPGSIDPRLQNNASIKIAPGVTPKSVYVDRPSTIDITDSNGGTKSIGHNLVDWDYEGVLIWGRQQHNLLTYSEDVTKWSSSTGMTVLTKTRMESSSPASNVTQVINNFSTPLSLGEIVKVHAWADNFEGDIGGYLKVIEIDTDGNQADGFVLLSAKGVIWGYDYKLTLNNVVTLRVLIKPYVDSGNLTFLEVSKSTVTIASEADLPMAVIGDSIITGAKSDGRTFASMYAKDNDADCMFRSVGGAVISAISSQLDSIATQKLGQLFMDAGTNDILRGGNSTDIIAATKALIGKALTRASHVYFLLNPITGSWNQFPQDTDIVRKAVNAEIRSFYSGKDNITLIDSEPYWSDGVNILKDHYEYDDVHPDLYLQQLFYNEVVKSIPFTSAEVSYVKTSGLPVEGLPEIIRERGTPSLPVQSTVLSLDGNINRTEDAYELVFKGDCATTPPTALFDLKDSSGNVVLTLSGLSGLIDGKNIVRFGWSSNELTTNVNGAIVVGTISGLNTALTCTLVSGLTGDGPAITSLKKIRYNAI